LICRRHRSPTSICPLPVEVPFPMTKW